MVVVALSTETADGILTGPYRLRGTRVDDNDVAPAIAVVEQSSALQRDAQR